MAFDDFVGEDESEEDFEDDFEDDEDYDEDYDEDLLDLCPHCDHYREDGEECCMCGEEPEE